jgi:hypothetical protein
MAGSAREEAERLVAAILARAAASSSSGTGDADVLGFLGESVAGLVGKVSGAAAHSGGAWATGSAECCVCPVCKVIAAMRDPAPETAERLATSAGDIATGVAGLLRTFAGMAGERSRPPAPRTPRPANPDGVWSTATASEEPAADGPEPEDPWAAVSAADAREAAAAARARAAAAEEAVARAVEQARRARRTTSPDQAMSSGRTPDDGSAGPRTRSGSDVWAMATAEAAADEAGGHRSVDHDLGASAPEDRDAVPGDDARAGGAV